MMESAIAVLRKARRVHWFRTYSAPDSWMSTIAQDANSESSDDEYTSCGSLSDDSVDSDSDAEACKLTLRPHTG